MGKSVTVDLGRCEACAAEGDFSIAEYVCIPEEESLSGPMMGDPDFWPSMAEPQRGLCERHYRELPPDCRIDYVPVEN